MRVLRLKIYQPHAHYRVPFTFSRRHTYPIPPYSTVIGLVCNVLGIKGPIEDPESKIESLEISFREFADNLYLAICGKFESMTREYIWLRNLCLTGDAGHLARFGSATNRIYDHVPEHPGGQMPTRIDVLEGVRLRIYIAHKNDEVTERIKEAFRNPERRIDPLHLGRAEDWIVFDGNPEESIKIIDPIKQVKLYGQGNFFTWIPDYRARYGGEDFKYVGVNLNGNNSDMKNFKNFFDKIQGSYHLISSFYKLKDRIRLFEYIPVKLFEGGSYPLHFGKPFEFFCDEETDEYFKEPVPLFFARMKYPEG